jgi:uncharacterized protein YxjI
MNAVLDRNQFFVKEHLGIFKAANNFDILDPESGQVILECREPNLGMLTKVLRFTDYKRMTPFDVQITQPSGALLLSVRRGVSIFRSNVEVFDHQNKKIGEFRQKLLSIGGKFELLDANGRSLCWLKGSWTSWDFSFDQDGKQLAQVSKKWAGLGKELFTSADNYMLSIDASVAGNDPLRPLILAAVMCIDMVLKE